MRIFITFIIFILLVSFSHAQNECGPASGYTGTLYEKYANGGTREQNVYLNGVKHGICCTYYLDGTLRSQVKYNLGIAGEILKKPDPEHDASDDKILHPRTNYEYKTYNNPGPTKWTSQGKMLNDSTKLLTSYWDGRLFIEQKFVKSIVKWERTYFLENEATSIYGHYNGNVEHTYIGSNDHYKYKTWFNNGNIKEEHEYLNNHEVGIEKHYFNNTKHTLKSISYYNKDYDYNIDEYCNNNLMCTTKYFDSSGVFTGYELRFGRATKQVTFRDVSFANTWISHHYYGDSITGTIEDDKYVIQNVYNEKAKRVIKHGNGKINSINVTIADPLYLFRDSIKLPTDKSKREVWYIMGPESTGPSSISWNTMLSSAYNNLDFKMFHLPWYCKGKVVDGYLEGDWIQEEEDDIYYRSVKKSDEKPKIRFYGRYEKSLRQGIWTYENSLYKYTISYVDGKKDGNLKISLRPDAYENLDYIKDHIANNERFYGEGFSYSQNDYDNALRVFIGSYKNDEMNGEWICYYRFPDQIAFKVIFENGKYIGKSEEYNLKQQLVYRATIVNGKLSNEKFYTPFGEEYDKKNLLTEPYNNVYNLKESDSNGKVKRELTWNNYNGWIVTNCTYVDGKRNGEWILTYDAVVQTVNYKNDTIDGPYKYERNTWRGKDSTIGNYSMRKKIGEWVTTNMEDSSYKKEVHMDDECFLITYKKGNTQFVTNGNGVVTEIAEGLQTKTEQYYKSGKKYKTVLIYINTNQIASIEYNTERGDSLAYYMPPETGTCIKNGTGMKTTLDELKRIAGVDYYKNGKLIKKDVYSDGAFYRTYYFHLSSDTSSSAGTKPVIEKIITKPFYEDDYYNVTIKISNLPKNATVIYIGEGYEFDINKGEQMKIINGEAYRMGSNVTKKISLIPKQPFNKNFIEIEYRGSIYSSLLKSNAQVLIYTIDKKSYTIDARYPITD